MVIWVLGKQAIISKAQKSMLMKVVKIQSKGLLNSPSDKGGLWFIFIAQAIGQP